MKFTFSQSISSIALMIFLLLSNDAAYAQNLVASVNRNIINADQALILTLTYQGDADTQQLDLTPLRKDFDILNTRPQSSSNISIINGQRTEQTTTSWRIGLIAKRLGKLTIPPMTVKNANSQAIQVTVNKAGSNNQAVNVISATLATNKRTAYVGEQVLLTLTITLNSNVGNLSGDEPSESINNLEKIDEQNESIIENGIAKNQLKITYALFPETPGMITIPTFTYTGTIGGRRSLFDNFGSRRSQQVVARTKAQSITVIAAPKDNTHVWFIANNVSVTSKWSSDINTAKVGEPITRTIAVVAQGQKAAAIPPLKDMSDTNHYRAYNDQAQLDNRITQYGYIGTRTQSIAFVPTAPGKFTIPESRISWWHNQSKQWREAIVPAQTITVAAADIQANLASSTAPNTLDTAILDTAIKAPLSNSNSNLIYWQYATLLFALLSILQFCLLLPKGREKQKQADDNKTSLAQLWTNLEDSIKQQQPQFIRQNINALHQAIRPEATVFSINHFATLCKDKADQTAIKQLDQHLYSDRDIDYSEFSQAIQTLKKELTIQQSAAKKDNRLSSTKLSPLYPSD